MVSVTILLIHRHTNACRICLQIKCLYFPPGIIVRCIQRLDETCRDVKSAAAIIGDPDLVDKMEQGSSLIKRDIVFAGSLYTS